jgi:hypothetical protein
MLTGVCAADRRDRWTAWDDQLIGDTVLVDGVRRGGHEIVEVESEKKNQTILFLNVSVFYLSLSYST